MSRDKSDSDGSSFADAMRNVRPLADRDKRVAPAGKGRERREEGNCDPSAAAQQPVRFHHPEPDNLLLGTARGIQARQLRRLRDGQIRPETEIDLHQLAADDAQRALRNTLLQASEEGLRCVRVIHGRGLHSANGPVLRRALPEWLAQPMIAERILAFAPATPADGGSGATYVLLRRKRGRA